MDGTLSRLRLFLVNAEVTENSSQPSAKCSPCTALLKRFLFAPRHLEDLPVGHNITTK